MRQRQIPAAYWRGGTSRALMFHRRDLPTAIAEDGYAAWNDLFLAAIGSPDPNGRQLNGIGGGISSLSKVAVIGHPSRPDADVDYTFGQVGVTMPTVSYRGNCGNISSAVGPFAVDEGLVAVSGDTASIRIHNTNTAKIIHASFPVCDGRPMMQGDLEMQGVAGTGAPIRLDFLDPGGAATGRLLPTGSIREFLALPDGSQIEVSMVDAANPVCFARAGDFGLSGRENPSQIAGDSHLMARLVDLRVTASLAMGIASSQEEARGKINNLPLICLVARPDPSCEKEQTADLVIRMLSMDQPHKATPLTGALCTAAAAGLGDGLVAEHLRQGSDPTRLHLLHPSGIFPVAVEMAAGQLRSAAVYRTARRIMRGMVDC